MGCVRRSESGDEGKLSPSSQEDFSIWLMDFRFESKIWGVRRPKKQCAIADATVIFVLRTVLMLKTRIICMKKCEECSNKKVE